MPPNVVLFPNDSGKTRYLDAGASHARFYADWRHLDAFKTLSSLQRAILQDILMEFSRVTGNEVRLTGHGVAKRYHVGHRTAAKAIVGLEERGWLERIGLSPGPTGQAGGVYQILCIAPNGSHIGGLYQTWTAPKPNKRNSLSDARN